MWRAILLGFFLAGIGFAQGIWFLRNPKQVVQLRRAIVGLMLNGRWRLETDVPMTPWEELVLFIGGFFSIGFGAIVLLVLLSILSPS